MRLFFLLLLVGLSSCAHKQEKADLVIHNAQIYLVDQGFATTDAMAITDGKIVEVGPEREILNKYRADEFIDMAARPVFPLFYNTDDPLETLKSMVRGENGIPLEVDAAILNLTLFKARNRYEEDVRGSLNAGMEASFVVFNGDPIDGNDLDDCSVAYIFEKGEQKLP